MPKIKWLGIIKGEPADYQKGELAENAVKMKMPSDMNEMMSKSIIFALPFIILIAASVFFKVMFSETFPLNFWFIPIGFVIGILLAVPHELLHAVVFPKNAVAYIGFSKNPPAAMVLASYPMKKGRFILMSLLPLILGIVPMVIFWLAPCQLKELNGVMLGMAAIGLISPSPDIYNVVQVIKQVPKGRCVQFYGDDTYWIEQ